MRLFLVVRTKSPWTLCSLKGETICLSFVIFFMLLSMEQRCTCRTRRLLPVGSWKVSYNRSILVTSGALHADWLTKDSKPTLSSPCCTPVTSLVIVMRRP